MIFFRTVFLLITLCIINFFTLSCDNSGKNSNMKHNEYFNTIPEFSGIKSLEYSKSIIKDGKILFFKEYYLDYIPTSTGITTFKKDLKNRGFEIYKDVEKGATQTTFNGIQWEVIKNASLWHTPTIKLLERLEIKPNNRKPIDTYSLNLIFADLKKKNIISQSIICIQSDLSNIDAGCIVIVGVAPYISENSLVEIYDDIKIQNETFEDKTDKAQ